jgi:hypothetical protein
MAINTTKFVSADLWANVPSVKSFGSVSNAPKGQMASIGPGLGGPDVKCVYEYQRMNPTNPHWDRYLQNLCFQLINILLL